MAILGASSETLATEGCAALIGVVTHRFLFIHGEWHVQAPWILCIHLSVFFCGIVGSSLWSCLPYLHALYAATSVAVAYLTGMFGSIVCYRLFFHRLRYFPGPAALKVSKIWHMLMTTDSKNYRYLGELNQKYGDFVRTGPSEITVFHPEAFMAIDGPRSDCAKAEFYDLLLPSTLSLVTSRNKRMHGMRRRLWSKGFSPRAVVRYNQTFVDLLQLLEACIDEDIAKGQVSEMTNLFIWFGFDAMGHFVFQKTFSMLQDRKWHFIIRRLQRGLSAIGILAHTPWLTHVAFKCFPRVWLLDDYYFMREQCDELMRDRLLLPQDASDDCDLAHYLVEDYKRSEDQKDAWRWLSGDALLALVAGSEPITFTLIGLFNELALHPADVEIVRRELEGANLTNEKALARLDHLDGVIQEVLRLYPALPTGGNRKTSAGGIWISDTYIPPHTTIVAPRYCIGRRADCFVRPNDFIPERWYSRSELRLRQDGFAPFGLGSRSCLGQALGMDAVRLVTARLVNRYDFEFADARDTTKVNDAFTETFTSKLGQLRLRARHRV